MNDLTTTRTPEVIAAEIRALTSTALSTIIEIGRRFAEAKAMIPHGEWGNWLKESTGYSQRTAQNFMRLYEAYGDEQGSLFGASAKTKAFADLPYSKALALLSVPEEEREEFAEAVDAEGISLRELQEEIKKRDAQLRDAQEEISCMIEDNKDLTCRLRQVEEREGLQAAELQRLRNQPTDVAVREPTPEELESFVEDRLLDVTRMHALELAEINAEREKLSADLEKAQMAERAAKDKIKNLQAEQEKAVESARAEGAKESTEAITRLKQELAVAQSDVRTLTDQKKALERSATLAQEPVITFRAYFTQWQKAHKAMLEALERAAEEPAKKLKAAMVAQLDAWLKEVQ